MDYKRLSYSCSCDSDDEEGIALPEPVITERYCSCEIKSSSRGWTNMKICECGKFDIACEIHKKYETWWYCTEGNPLLKRSYQEEFDLESELKQLQSRHTLILLFRHTLIRKRYDTNHPNYIYYYIKELCKKKFPEVAVGIAFDGFLSSNEGLMKILLTKA